MASDFKQTDKESVSVDNQLSSSSRESLSNPSSAGSHRNRSLLRCYHDLAMHLFNTGHEREVEKLFIVAARDGQYERVENFLQRRTHEIVNIDVKDPMTGNTPLMWAAKHGHEKIVQLLLKYGADVTLNNFEHQTAIEVAQLNVRKILISSVDRTGSSPRHLLQAAWQGNLKVVQKLLNESKVLDINCRNADSLTPLLLVTRDVDLFHKLGDAMKNYNPEAVIMELLLNRADANSFDSEGRTALHYATSLKCKLAEKVTLALLQDGSLVEARDNRCITPMHSASQNGQVEVLLALLAKGADVNTRGYAGTTPLHVSAQANQLQSVNTLLNQGADVTLVDDRGYTPVDVARNKKMKSTLKDAWMEATSNNKHEMTVLSPVKPPSRASLSHIAGDDKTPRLTPRDVMHTNGSERVNMLQKMTEAHRAVKVEEQILKDLDAGLFPLELSSKRLKTPIPPRTPKSDKTSSGSSPSNQTPLLERSKVKRTLFDSQARMETERGTRGHQKLAQRHSDPARRTDMVDYNHIPVTVVGLDLDENIDDIRFHRLLHCPINGIIERQKKRCSLPEVTPLPPYRSTVIRRKSTPNKPVISEVLDVVNDFPKQDQLQGRLTTPSPLHDAKLYPFSKTVLPPSPSIHLDTQNIRQETIFEYDSGTEESQLEIPCKRTHPKPNSGNHLRTGTLMSQKRTFNIEMSRVKGSEESDQSSTQSSMSCTSSSMSSFSTPSPHDSPRDADLMSDNKDCRITNRMGVKMTPAATVTRKLPSTAGNLEVTDVDRVRDSLPESDHDSGVVSSSSSPPIKRSNTAKKVLLREVSEDFTAKVFPVNCESHPDTKVSNKPLSDVVRVNFITSSQPAKTKTKNDSVSHNGSRNSSGKMNTKSETLPEHSKLSAQENTPSRVSTSAKPSLLLHDSDKDAIKINSRICSKSACNVKPSINSNIKNKLETLNCEEQPDKNVSQNNSGKMNQNPTNNSPGEKIISSSQLSTQQNLFLRVTTSAKPIQGSDKDDLKIRTFSKSAGTVKQSIAGNTVKNTLETLNPVPVMSKTSPNTKPSPKLSNGTPSVSKSFSGSQKQKSTASSVSVVKTDIKQDVSKEKNGLNPANSIEKPQNNDKKNGCAIETLKKEHSDESKKVLLDENVIKTDGNSTTALETTKANIAKKNSITLDKKSSNNQQNSQDVTSTNKVELLEKPKIAENIEPTSQPVKKVSEKVVVIQKGDTPKPHVMGKKAEMQVRPVERSNIEDSTAAKLTPRIPSAPKPTGPGRPKSQFKSPDTSPRLKDAELDKSKQTPDREKSGKEPRVHNTPVICDMFENIKTRVESKGVKIQVADKKKALKQSVRSNSGKQKRSQSAAKEKTSNKESSKVVNKANSTNQMSSVNKKKKVIKDKPDTAGKSKGKSKPAVKTADVKRGDCKKTQKKGKKKPSDTMVVKDTDVNTTAFISGQGWHIKTKKNESDNVIIHDQSLMDDLSDSDESVKLSPHNTLKIQEMARMRSMTQEQVCNLVNVMSPLEANTPRYIPNTMGTIKQLFADAFKENSDRVDNLETNEQTHTSQFSFEKNDMKTICEVKEREILLQKKGNKDIVEGHVKGLTSNLLTPRSEADNLSFVSESSYETNPELLKVFKIPDHVDEEEQEPNDSDVEEIEVEPVNFVEDAVVENLKHSVEEHNDHESNQAVPDTRHSSAKSTSSQNSSSTNRKTTSVEDCKADLANKPPLPSYQPKKLPKSAFKKRHSEPVINSSQDQYDELNEEYFDERMRKHSAGLRGQSAKILEQKPVEISTANCHPDKETSINERSEFSILDNINEKKNVEVKNTVARNQSESVFDDDKNVKAQRAEVANQQSPANYVKVLDGTDSSPPVKLQRPSEDSDSFSDEENDLLSDSLAQSVMSDVLEKTFSETSRTGSSWSADSVTRTSILGKGRSHSSRVSSSDRSHSSSTTVSEPEEELLHWKKGNILGKGAFGKVYCGLTNTGQLIAVKQVELSERDKVKSENQYEKLQEEVELLKNLRHKNIVGFLGVSLEDEIVNIFMQFIPGGSIASLLARFGTLDEPVFCRYTKQILEGIEYLHTNNVIHRDIKGANIMLMSNGIIKLIDFGCAKRLCINLSQSQSVLMSMRGTPYWMAPEVIMETGHGTKSDIWSIGCTVFEMATRKPPWAEMPPMTAIYYIGSGSGPVPQLPDQFSKEARSFVSICLSRDQHERPTATNLLKHAFIRKRRERGRDRFSTRISSSTFEEGNINFKEKPKTESAKDKSTKKPIYDFS